MNAREKKERIEDAILAPTGQASKLSRGRVRQEALCEVRTVYECDVGRILYSLPFRRLRQKTQVFFNPQNDHICTRMEHVLYVAYLAETIGRALYLNTDLIRAIAYGHDIGHPPFGHAGERTINEIVAAKDGDFVFEHESHSLRVCAVLAEHNNKAGPGLNLSYEVLDGIVSHCGELYGEFTLIPDRQKSNDAIFNQDLVHPLPFTLEGCLVRIVDRIAYVGRDIEDARRAGLMHFEDIPQAVRKTLGQTNSEIVNSLVRDVIQTSAGQDRIAMSTERGEALEQLIRQNVEQIYHSSQIARYEEMASHVLHGLFDAFLPRVGLAKEKQDKNHRGRITDFYEFVDRHPEKDVSPLRLVTDYVAGMTDHFARTVFDDLYLV